MTTKERRLNHRFLQPVTLTKSERRTISRRYRDRRFWCECGEIYRCHGVTEDGKLDLRKDRLAYHPGIRGLRGVWMSEVWHTRLICDLDGATPVFA